MRRGLCALTICGLLLTAALGAADRPQDSAGTKKAGTPSGAVPSAPQDSGRIDELYSPPPQPPPLPRRQPDRAGSAEVQDPPATNPFVDEKTSGKPAAASLARPAPPLPKPMASSSAGAAASPSTEPPQRPKLPVPPAPPAADSSAQPQAPPSKPAPQPEVAKDEKPEDETCEEEDTCRWCHCGKLGEPWKLFHGECLKEHDITISGWSQAGIFANQFGAPTNGPLALNNLTNFNLHQLWLYAERKADAEKHGGFDIGGRVDHVFGIDAPDTQCFGDRGWDWGWNDALGIYGSAIPQAYAEVAFGKWTVKGGHFNTPHGYEIVPPTGNFFYSHSYAFRYAEPFTHTGFQATYKAGDKLSVFGGWVDGWDSGFANRNGADTFLGGFNLALSEKTSLAWAVNVGNWGTGAIGNAGDIFFHSLVLTHKFNCKWTYVLQHDLGANMGLVPGGTWWYNINHYLIRKINDCWSAGGRFEWFCDRDGVRVIPGNAGSYFDATLGLNYKPHSNFLLRPEIRWDWYNGTVAAGSPFNAGLSQSQFSGGFDMILTF